jgi:Holliday junction resolvase RusA-like endonuclease
VASITEAQLNAMLQRGCTIEGESTPVGSPQEDVVVKTARILIDPMPAPRLNKNSRYNPEKKLLAERYSVYKQHIAMFARQSGLAIGDEIHCVFVLAMPKSWSKTKRRTMNGQPHQQRPDGDNLYKAVLDAIMPEDKLVWSGSFKKYWGTYGHIIISTKQGEHYV